MSNPMKYIKALEAVGFARNQAEAQVQMVLDALEGELVTKADLGLLKSDMDARFAQVDSKFAQVDARFDRMEERFERRLIETEFRLLTRLGFLMVSTTTIAVAVLTWLIKI